jgi:hypothetical protein
MPSEEIAMEKMEVNELRALLATYREVASASWPTLHPQMTERAPRWSGADADSLQRELESYLRDASKPDCTVRVFWKLGEGFRFGGCNIHFAKDAGLSSVDEIIGIDDFDKKLPWRAQSAKYRADDQEVFKSGLSKLDIVERQQSSSGITWVRAGKAPIRLADRTVIGILGMYEIMDPAEGRRLWTERLSKTKSPSGVA